MAVTWSATFKNTPAGTDSPTEGDDRIRELKDAIQERMTNEHYTVDDAESTGTAVADWLHKAGSAKLWYQATAPATKPNGEALAAVDAGRLWQKSDEAIPTLYSYSGSAFAEVLGDTTYVSMTAVQTVAGAKTFSDAGIFQSTLGVTGNFAVATNKFTVAAATGNTVVAGTLGVTGAATLSSTLAVTGDVAVATNKFTVAAASGNTLVAGTLGVTGAITGTLATAAQTNITSLGTLTALQVDNLNLNLNTISSTSGAINITPVAGSAIVLDAVISVDAGVVTGATSITSTAFVGTLSTAAQPNVTSLGTLTILNVDNLRLDGNTLSATTGAVNITPLAGSAIVLDGTISVDAGVVTGATSITSTAFVGNLTGNASGTAATVTGAAQAAITSLGTLTTLTVDNINLDGSTITGMSNANTVLTAYAGKAIAVEGVTFDGGVVAGVTSLATGAITTTSTIGRDADNLLSWETDDRLVVTTKGTSLNLEGFAKAATGAGDRSATFDVIIPTQAYVDKQIYDLTIGGVVAASEAAAGIAELATQAETNTGTDDLRIVTPLKLKTNLATPPAIGATTPSTGTFTTLTVSEAVDPEVSIGNTALGGANCVYLAAESSISLYFGDAADPDQCYLRNYPNDGTQYFMFGRTTSNGNSVQIRPGGNIPVIITAEGTRDYPVLGLVQQLTTAPFFKIQGGSSVTTPLGRSLVKDSDVTTPTVVGWMRMEIDDTADRLTDGEYFIPFYSLV